MGGQIFDGFINGRATAWMMIAMLIFAVIWESFTDYLEERLEENKAHREMLSKVYKELMILGFIAFAVILGKEVGAVTMNTATLHCFEFCDLLVSICVLIYVANTAISSFAMHTAQREWDRIAMTPTVAVMEDVSFYLEGLEKSRWKRIKHSLPFIAKKELAMGDFKVLELLFKKSHHLPSHFDYVMYMKLVLEDVVVSLANISTLHWLVVMLVNFLWWVGMVGLLPLLGSEPTAISEDICLFPSITGCDEQSAHRRQLGGGAAAPQVCQANLVGDTCQMNATELEQAVLQLRSESSEEGYVNQCDQCLQALSDGPGDIGPAETMRSLYIFVAFGWFIAAMQALIVANLGKRMRCILDYINQDTESDDQVPAILERLQRSLLERQLLDPTGFAEVANHHNAHSMSLTDMAQDLAETETTEDMITFKGAGKTSNEVMSIRDFDWLLFTTIMLQLLIDFYLGFYAVHMKQRVAKAYEGDDIVGTGAGQYLFHAAILGAVVMTLRLLMITTRKIALLVGVLHLSNERSSDVLAFMEQIKSLRDRIQDGLAKTQVVDDIGNDPKEAERLLEAAEKGELAVLELMAEKKGAEGRDARISGSEIRKIWDDHAEFLTVTKADLDAFLDRETFRKFVLLLPVDQATAMSAKTLRVGGGDGLGIEAIDSTDPGTDTITIRELSTLLVRIVADVLLRCLELSPSDQDVQQFTSRLKGLDSVEDDMVTYATRLARAKAIFRHTDSDGSGSVDRKELYRFLRAFKVPMTCELLLSSMLSVLPLGEGSYSYYTTTIPLIKESLSMQGRTSSWCSGSSTPTRATTWKCMSGSPS